MKIRRPAWLDSLTVTVVVTVLLALGFQAWMLAQGRRRDLEIISTRAANRAQATAHRVQEIFKEVDLLLLDIRERLDPEDLIRGPGAIPPKRDAAMRAYLHRQAAKVPQVMLLHVVGQDGRYVFSSNDVLPGVDISDRNYFQEQRDAIADEMRVSDPFLGRVSGRWGVFPTRRVTDSGGRFAGLVIATLDTEALGKVMVAVDQAQWVLSLHAMDHRLIARSPAGPIGTRLVEPRMDSIWKGPIAFEGASMGEREPHLWAGWQVPGTSLYTVAGYRKAQALAQWNQDLKINAAVACLLVAGCAGILVLQRRSRKSAESALQLQERLAIAAQGAGIGIFDWNRDRRTVHWDDGMYRLLGLRREDLPSPGETWLDRVDDRDRDRVRADFRAALATEGLHLTQFRARKPDASVVHLRVAARNLGSGFRGPARMVGIVYDVTQAEEAQEAL
ncbi:MAG: PAS domain-containing protein, partial [Holophaga sp.]|nr:PAS domain-containing protein [Holophaga sp.]